MPKILIIEDNEDNMELASLLLKSDGYAVICAEDAFKGIELAKSEQPDLILMDIQLPVMDGIAATAKIKQDPEIQHIKVVALTAYAMKGDKEKILSQGLDGYISKPFFRKEFLGNIRRFLTL